MNLSITDRVALVTGAAGGLGVAESETLARAGGRVLMLDVEAERGRDAAAAINARLPAGTPPVRFVAADLADLAASAALAGRLSEEAGGIDILVNNAAVIPHKPIEDYGLDEYERIQRVNAHAAFALAQAVLPAMKRRRRGVIINLCSITLSGGWTDFVPYVASKGALLGMTRAMARELGPFDIRVNAVSPGAMPTEAETRVFGDRWEEYNRFILEHQSLKRRGTAADIANAVLWLASDAANFITGQTIDVNGGWLMN